MRKLFYNASVADAVFIDSLCLRAFRLRFQKWHETHVEIQYFAKAKFNITNSAQFFLLVIVFHHKFIKKNFLVSSLPIDLGLLTWQMNAEGWSSVCAH